MQDTGWNVSLLPICDLQWWFCVVWINFNFRYTRPQAGCGLLYSKSTSLQQICNSSTTSCTTCWLFWFVEQQIRLVEFGFKNARYRPLKCCCRVVLVVLESTLPAEQIMVDGAPCVQKRRC